MSTTRLWDESDNDDEVRHAQMRALYEMDVIILRWT